MKTKVIGKITETSWELEGNYHTGEDGKIYFTARPEIKKHVRECAPHTICEYEGAPQSSCYTNNLFSFNCGVYIDGEFVREEKKEFHADIPEWRQYVDKVVKNIDFYKEEVEEEYYRMIREYNSYVINGDKKLAAYCKLHKLKPEETDADELKEIVYGNNISLGFCNSLSNNITIGNFAEINNDNITIGNTMEINND